MIRYLIAGLGMLCLSNTLPGIDIADSVGQARHNSEVQVVRLDDPHGLAYLADLKIHVRVSGVLARITITMILRNDAEKLRHRNLKKPFIGYLRLPVPEGAAISSYSTDIENYMLAGIPVGSVQARRIREAEFLRPDRRQFRDSANPTLPSLPQVPAAPLTPPVPAGGTHVGINGRSVSHSGKVDMVVFGPRQEYERLYPMTGAGLVRWRVPGEVRTWLYPIPALNSRSAAISYVTAVQEDGSVRVPLQLDAIVPRLSLEIAVDGVCEQTPSPPRAFPRLVFRKRRRQMVASDSRLNATVTHGLLLALPRPEAPRAMLQQSSGKNVHFAINVPVPLRPDREHDAPNLVTILWDTSASHGQADHRPQFDFLRAYFARPVFPAGGVALTLVPFGIRTGTPRHLRIIGGNVADLLGAIRDLRYDGGTQMGCLPPGNLDRPELYLLFGDGRTSFGKAEINTFDAPVHCLASGSFADHKALRELAGKNGGRYVNLDLVPGGVAASWLGQKQPWEFLGVDVKAGRVAGLSPAPASAAGSHLIVTGHLQSKRAKLVVKYGIGQRVHAQQEYSLKRSEAKNGDTVRSYWAGQWLAQLQAGSDADNKVIRELGTTCGVVTPLTSLVVMETCRQYTSYGLQFPRELLKIRQERLMGRRKQFKARPERGKPLPSGAGNGTKRISAYTPHPDDLLELKEKAFLKTAGTEDFALLYRDQRRSCRNDLGFYLAWAQVLFEHKQPEMAKRILTNVLEMLSLHEDKRSWELWTHFCALLRGKKGGGVWDKNEKFFRKFSHSLHDQGNRRSHTP